MTNEQVAVIQQENLTLQHIFGDVAEAIGRHQHECPDPADLAASVTKILEENADYIRVIRELRVQLSLAQTRVLPRL